MSAKKKETEKKETEKKATEKKATEKKVTEQKPEKKTEKKKIIETKKKEVPKPKQDINEVIISQYFQRYKTSILANKPKVAILDFVNISNHVNRYPKLFTKVCNLFIKNKHLLLETLTLQGIDTIEAQIKLKLEVFYLMLRVKVLKDKMPVNFSRMGELIQNEDLLVEYRKAYKSVV